METTSITRHRQTLAADALELPGLRLFGHNLSSKAAFPMGLHIHPGAMEFVVVIKGSESYCAGGKLYPLSGGDVFISFVDEPHGNGAAPQGIGEIIWFQVDPSPRDLFGLSADRAGRLSAKLLSLEEHTMKADAECLALLKKSFAAFLRFDDASRRYASALFVSFLTRVLFLQRQDSAGDARISRAVDHIRENAAAPLPLEELAQLAGMSLSGFKHRFRDVTGKTPRDFINHAKIEKAKTFLQSGKSVTDTAMELGFNSSDYFAVVFRKLTAQTPTQYREGFTGTLPSHSSLRLF